MRETEREREREREGDRERERQRDRETERQRETETETETERPYPFGSLDRQFIISGIKGLDIFLNKLDVFFEDHRVDFRTNVFGD